MTFNATQVRHAPLSQTKRRVVGFLLVAALVVLGAAYLFEVNTTAARGYDIGTLQQQLKDLKIKNQALQAQASEQQSFQTTEQQLPSATYVAVQRVEYLSGTTPSVGVALK